MTDNDSELIARIDERTRAILYQLNEHKNNMEKQLDTLRKQQEVQECALTEVDEKSIKNTGAISALKWSIGVLLTLVLTAFGFIFEKLRG